MPGCVPHLEAQRADLHVLTGRERTIGWGQRVRECQAKGGRLRRRRIVEWPVGRMQRNGRAGLGCYVGHTHDMIDVRVGQPDRVRLPPGLFDLMENEPRLLTRIDDDAATCVLVDDEIGILCERAVGDRNDVHGFAAPATWPFSRNALRYFSTAIAAVVASPTAVVI